LNRAPARRGRRRRVPGGQDAFRPAWWLRSGHLQTLWPTLFRRTPRVDVERERLELADGDFIDLDWAGPPAAPVVVALHGLEGSSASPYARGLLAACLTRGWRAVVAHFRGCSGEPNRLERGYHSGDTADLARVIAHVSATAPEAPVAVVGYSLGGNVLLKWLGECPGTARPVAAAVAVSVPFELDGVARRLERGASRLYQWHLLRAMRSRTLAKFRDRGAASIDLGRAARARTFREFDDAVTAPLHGFDGVDDYYGRSSSRQFLGGIVTPTLVVHALDDPFTTPQIVPAHGEVGAGVTLEITAGGGHVGFVEGSVPGLHRYWLEGRIPRFLAPHLEPGR